MRKHEQLPPVQAAADTLGAIEYNRWSIHGGDRTHARVLQKTDMGHDDRNIGCCSARVRARMTYRDPFLSAFWEHGLHFFPHHGGSPREPARDVSGMEQPDQGGGGCLICDEFGDEAARMAAAMGRTLFQPAATASRCGICRSASAAIPSRKGPPDGSRTEPSSRRKWPHRWPTAPRVSSSSSSLTGMGL
ncbi:hypothetical protein AHiyo8_03380 [Arthrobacter sp. Hiyo8]|nr:hypothetical protein AHiyo8_03380 [Arthrobacter sp. Hiyo8]